MGDVLDSASLLALDGLELADVACRHPRGRGEAGEVADRHGIVFVRRGYFVRSADGVETVLDPTLAYCVTPSVEQRFDHPHDDGDDCTALFLDDDLIRSLWGGDRDLPIRPIATTYQGNAKFKPSRRFHQGPAVEVWRMSQG